MKPTFLTYDKPLLTAIFSVQNPVQAKELTQKAIAGGAEGFCMEMARMEPEYYNEKNFREYFAMAQGLPIYVTNYRYGVNEHYNDEQIAEGTVRLAQCGATLCDIMGDMFDRQPGEMSYDSKATDKQKVLIERLHSMGAEVLMSSHVLKYTPAEEVLRIAKAQEERGVDIVKIVTYANSMEEQIENLRINRLLQQELHTKFLFLSGGECGLHRRFGAMLGCCMYLCSLEDTNKVQPQLWKAKAVRDSYDWKETEK